MHFKKKLWIGILLLTLLTPLGIIIPEKFKAGDAWGEWSFETIKKDLGFAPEKLKQNSEIWKAPVPDYNFGKEESAFPVRIVSYIVSGIIGIAVIALLVFVLKKIIIKYEK